MNEEGEKEAYINPLDEIDAGSPPKKSSGTSLNMYLKTRGTNEAGGLKPCLLHNDCALDWEPNFPSLLLFLFGITLRCWHSTWWCGQGRAAEYSRAVCTLVCMRYPCTEISPTDHQ